MTKTAVRLAASGMLIAAAIANAQTIGLRGRKLTAVAGSRLVLVVRDSGVALLPDPLTTGATLTVTPGGGGGGTLPLPAGPEWSVTPGALNRYRNPAAPAGPSACGSVVIRNGKALRAVCRGLGGLTLPTTGDIEVVLGDGNGFEQVMCLTADVNDGSRLVADNPTFAAGRCPQCTHTLTWGSRGPQPGEFHGPFDVAVDAGGNVYVADFGNARIQKFDGNGTFLDEWSTGSPQITGIAVDAAGDLYVSQYQLISKWSPGGTLLDTWGSFGNGDGQFMAPEGIAVDGSGNVYVSDATTSRIQKFDGGGTFLASWGSFGSGNGQFLSPHGMATDGSGNVYVADSGNHRIQKFDGAGTFLAAWGTLGSGTGQFQNPRGVEIDAAGNVYVADTENNRIQKFDSAGNFEKAWGKFGGRPSQFYLPFALTVDASGNVFVADSRNDRMQKFACP